MKNQAVLSICGFMLLVGTLTAQEDIEKYLLTDSLEIESLVQGSPTAAESGELRVKAFTQVGIMVRQFGNLASLNQALQTKGYGQVPDMNPGWMFATRIDIDQNLTLGFSYGGNYFIAAYQKGPQLASRYTYFDFLVSAAYRQQLAGFQIAPGLGLGISQNTLTLKPNDLQEIEWNDLHVNSDLITAVTRVDLALSVDLSMGKYIRTKNNAQRLLDVKLGYLFHPLSFGKPGIPISEINMVKIKDMPEMNSSGPYLHLSWGFGGKD